MLHFDLVEIGNRLYTARKRSGLTQAEVAEKAGISGRTYADIERGTVNMRVETLVRICNALNVSPDMILGGEAPSMEATQEELLERLKSCSDRELKTALTLLSVYLTSL